MQSGFLQPNCELLTMNPSCPRATFAERFDGLPRHGRKTKRLMDKILDIAIHTNSVAASEILSDGIADVCKNAICGYIKKRYSGSRMGKRKGSVNKIKVIKRVMFGRCGDDLLRAKVLRLEARRSSLVL